MEDRELIEKLKDQSTWRLFGLGFITYGVYFAYYVRRQTDKINAHLDGQAAISDGFVSSFFVMSYLSAALLVAYIFVPYGNPIETASDFADWIWVVMLLVWGFKARNRVNSVCRFDPSSPNWFQGVWTFLLTPLYFNYKVNQLNERSAAYVQMGEP